MQLHFNKGPIFRILCVYIILLPSKLSSSIPTCIYAPHSDLLIQIDLLSAALNAQLLLDEHTHTRTAGEEQSLQYSPIVGCHPIM